MTATDPARGRPLIVSIVGPSGAGKSQLAKLTQLILGDDIAARIPKSVIPSEAEGSPHPSLVRTNARETALHLHPR